MKPCNTNKLTGWKRDGFCRGYSEDKGSHTVCVIVSNEFLKFTLSKGNDLISKSYTFPGLVEGDRWCVCLERWFEAYLAGYAPKIIPESSDQSSLKELEKRLNKNVLHLYFKNEVKENYNYGCHIC